MWIVREGYEGLVRGNEENPTDEKNNNSKESHQAAVSRIDSPSQQQCDPNLLHNLRFGDGELLRDWTAEYVGGRTLKGRYIVRVGWDDVRGWFSEVRLSFLCRAKRQGTKNIFLSSSLLC